MLKFKENLQNTVHDSIYIDILQHLAEKYE